MNSNSTQIKDILKKLKADYFLQKLFSNLERKKLLEIIKYNKNIKERINININDYKEYSEIYSSIEIEIEIIPRICKYDELTTNIEEEKYYHIFFNDNKEEIKRNNIKENDKVKKIKLIIEPKIKTLMHLFSNGEFIESIYFKKFCRKNITDMSDMFSGCSSLKELNLNNFNTNNVTNMSGMFSGCSSLKELNLNNFNTNNVTNMSNMFSGCSSLKELNLNNFNTNNVTEMNGMFLGCSNELIMKIKMQYKNIKEDAFCE